MDFSWPVFVRYVPPALRRSGPEALWAMIAFGQADETAHSTYRVLLTVVHFSFVMLDL